MPVGKHFPTKPIWLVFDLCNGGITKSRYVWWFDTKGEADFWIKDHQKTPNGYDVSRPTRWFPK